MSSSYSSLDWVLSHWAHFTVRRFICVCVCVFNVFCVLYCMLYSRIISSSWIKNKNIRRRWIFTPVPCRQEPPETGPVVWHTNQLSQTMRWRKTMWLTGKGLRWSRGRKIDQTRWIKEALCIRKTRNTMNRDTGTFQLSHTWDRVIFGSRDTSNCTRGSDVNKMSACWHRNVVCWFFISCVISNVVICMLYYSSTMGWTWWDWSLILGWVTWPVITRLQYDL